MARACGAFLRTVDVMLLVRVACVADLFACDNGKTGCLDGHVDAAVPCVCDGVAHTAGVSSEPEFNVYEFNLNREDIILVMASDGLWEFMSNQEVMDIALHTTEPRFAVDRYVFG